MPRFLLYRPGAWRHAAGPAYDKRSGIPDASRRSPTPRWDETLGQIDGGALEVFERAEGERALVGGAQHHAWRAPGLERFLPARRAQAPTVVGLQPGEAVS